MLFMISFAVYFFTGPVALFCGTYFLVNTSRTKASSSSATTKMPLMSPKDLPAEMALSISSDRPHYNRV